MQFRLSSILLMALCIAAMCGWRVDRRRLQSEVIGANEDACRLAVELYRLHLKQSFQQPYGSTVPSCTRAIQLKTGDVLDLAESTDRNELLERLTEGETDFRVKDSMGKVLEIGDLLHLFPLCSGQPRGALAGNELRGSPDDFAAGMAE
ncbi:hypothetical protein NZK35_15130 [Stieleria sp. ICT_E10.1]|uniref:hypothetical protein n=1 Tax=Stieleria sedimenti TaxID=2976331 RepID=UPI002180565C|nr:hypothetical protein [Stieleria sedimenti]MCS7467986.1 hypothetical protein [Stieleria sedimenti]